MELNPNHPTTQQVNPMWHKLAAILVHKLADGHIVITSDDVAAVSGCGITVQELPDGLHLRLVSAEEGARLAQQHGGRPT